MTQDERDRTIGQARREYREARRELAALKMRARQIGEYLSALAAALQQDPLKARELVLTSQHFSAFTFEAIQALLLELQQATEHLAILRREFEELDGD